MRFGESNGALDLTKGMEEAGGNAKQAFWADFGQQNIAAATDWRHQILQ
jgi:hypothetical protein